MSSGDVGNDTSITEERIQGRSEGMRIHLYGEGLFRPIRRIKATMRKAYYAVFDNNFVKKALFGIDFFGISKKLFVI